MNRQRTRKWVSDLSAWVVSAVIHGFILVVLASIVLVVAQKKPVDAVVHVEPAVRSTQGFDAADAESQGGAPSQSNPADSARSESTAAPLPAPSTPAQTGTESLALEAVAAMNPANTDPALNILAELSNLGGAAAEIGQGHNPLLEGTTPGFQKMIGGMRGKGLDVVFVLDATDSMDEYFRQARERILHIIGVITGVLSVNDRPPRNVRFGVVAFKDYGDEFGIKATKVQPLTADFPSVRQFIDRIAVGGGADDPEPIDEALDHATNRKTMGWRRAKKNIIILVGDARVHTTGRDRAFAIARDFVRKLNGTINAIDVETTRQNVLPDFQLIAEAGGGTAYLLADKEKFWKELIISVFGQRFKQDVQMIVDRYAHEE